MHSAQPDHRFGPFVVNSAKRVLLGDGEPVKLRDREFDLLVFLIDRSPRPCSHDEIIENVWRGVTVENNSVEKAVANLRRSLGDDAKDPRYIRTVRGTGYLFVGELTAAADPSPKKESTPRGRFSRRRVFVGSALLILFIAAGFLAVHSRDLLDHIRSKVLFKDNFSGDSVDPNKWIVQGKSVTSDNGIATLSAKETDNWGRIGSKWITFDRNRPLIVRSRLKVSYSQNLKKSYFNASFGMAPRSSATEDEHIGSLEFFGLRFVNQDYESKYPNGDFEYVSSEGFFLVRNGGSSIRKVDERDGKVGPRMDPVWDRWFEQKIVYEPFSGKMTYFIEGQPRGEFNVGVFQTDIPTDQLRLEIIPEGWWLYHSIQLDYVEVSQ